MEGRHTQPKRLSRAGQVPGRGEAGKWKGLSIFDMRHIGRERTFLLPVVYVSSRTEEYLTGQQNMGGDDERKSRLWEKRAVEYSRGQQNRV